MTEFIKLQEDLYDKIVKALKNYKKTPKERFSVGYIDARLETLEQTWSSFVNNHSKIVVELEKEVLEATDYYTNDVYEKCEETYVEYKAMMKDKLFQLNPVQVTGNSSKPIEQRLNVKLPEISIPKFSGDYSEWASFRDLFTSLIHKNTSLDDVQRLHYLKASITGEAEQLLRHIPCTADNYKTCWNQLEGRYNNKRFLANALLKRLTGQSVLSTESASGIKLLLDTTTECMSGLENLGISTSSWDVIVIFLVSQKLDTESRKQWEQKVSDLTDKLPTLSNFTEFLKHRFRSLEFIDPKSHKQEKTNCTHVTTTEFSCDFCADNHKLFNCKKFAKENVDSRRNFVQTHHLCFNCLTPDHSVYQCTLSTRCRFCKKKHHSLLHPKIQKSADDGIKADQAVEKKVVATITEETPNSPQSPDEGPDPHIVACFSNTSSQVLLATALVKVESNKTQTAFVLRSLLDQGSQASFITEAAVQMLGLKKVPSTSIVSGLGGDQGSTLASKSAVILKIQSRLDPSFTITVKAHVLSNLTTFLPSKKVMVQILPTLTSMELADPTFDTPNKIDLLLGAEVYSQILLEGLVRGPPGSVIAQHTRFGWILSGTIHDKIENMNQDEIVVSMHLAYSNENELLKKFWELESDPASKQKHLTQEEQRCEELFAKTTSRDESGRFVVKLPFKSDDPICKYGGSKEIARKRFLMLERRLSRNPELKIEYSKVINEYISLGHMETVPESVVNKPDAVYLPHHAVVRQDKTTTKVRVVFDASCKGSNGVSLNDDLMVGPTLQPELRHLVMRWRRYAFSLVADIVKMYRQVKVAEEDADFQRLLWRENPGAELQHLRLLRVTFGTSSAPYLAVRALQELAHREGAKYPLASMRVINDFYMDDLMTGCHSVAEGIQIFEEITELLNSGGFPLQKFSSNSQELMDKIKAHGRVFNESLELKTDEAMKILGLMWNRETDEFQCTVKLPPVETPVTKRKVISDIARLFDPLGWMAPVVVKAKIFIQRLWLTGIEWDSPLPDSLLKEWIEFRNDLKSLGHLSVPRWIHSTKDDSCLELHGFSDASNAAYAAVIYARVVDKNGDVHVSLITSKTRVAPIKQVSIPRLELCGAVLAAKLLNEVAEILTIEKHNLHAWTDSSIVLAWLSSHPSRWKTFVANRVSEILTITDGNQWSHVASKENPADCASRGIQPSELVDNQLWKRGPEWLHKKGRIYGTRNVLDTNLEEKKMKVICHKLTCDDTTDDLLSRFSSLTRLVRVIAFCRRVLNWNKPEKEKPKKWLTKDELNASLLGCIKLCQRQCFKEEIENLQKGKLKKNSKLTSLNPFLDADEVLKVGGRLQNAQIGEEMKHPIIIPHNSHFTSLLVKEAHIKTMHGGPQLMLNYLRSKYWVIGAKGLARQCVHKCVACIRYSAQTNHQRMGQLPIARVTADRPFLKSGVDYAGPICIRTTKGRGYRAMKGYICLFVCMATRAIHLEVVSDRTTKGRGYRAMKGYICLFVCMATRAIHLEVVSDMTSETFLAAFKRFVSRRGHVAELWSDNGTTFVGSARELHELFDLEKSNVAVEIADWLASNGTSWHFIPPRSPNFGGLWEAGIKSTKHHLKRVIGDSTLTFEEMTTTLSQIEACLNSRPISQLPSNPEDPNPLTPGHFLIGEPLVLVPDANYESSNISSLRRWHLTQRMVQDFWRRWSSEYLTQLQHRYKWTETVPEPEIGSVVLVKEDDLPPARWLFGVVVDKHPGLDNLTRVVTLKYKGNSIKRPVSKLIVLPTRD